MSADVDHSWAERAVLGHVLIGPDDRREERLQWITMRVALKPEHFQMPHHREVWRALLADRMYPLTLERVRAAIDETRPGGTDAQQWVNGLIPWQRWTTRLPSPIDCARDEAVNLASGLVAAAAREPEPTTPQAA